MIDKIENVDELVTFREKRDNETQGEYIDYIKNVVIAGANEKINEKNVEIASLKTTIAQLKSENANLRMEAERAEKDQITSQFTDVEIKLRNVVEEIREMISNSENKMVSQDKSINVSLQKLNQLIEKYNEIEPEHRFINTELSKPVNFGQIQEYIKKQAEFEKLMQRLLEGMTDSKEQIMRKLESLEQNRSDVQTQTDEVKVDSNLATGALDTGMEQATIQPSVTEPIISAPEINSLTSDSSVEEKKEEVNENVLGSITQNENNAQPTFEHQAENGEQKVTSVEPAPQSTIDQGQGIQTPSTPVQSGATPLSPTSTKMTRSFVDKVKAKTSAIIKKNLKGQKAPYANVPQETIDRFDQNLVSQDEQTPKL